MKKVCNRGFYMIYYANRDKKCHYLLMLAIQVMALLVR